MIDVTEEQRDIIENFGLVVLELRKANIQFEVDEDFFEIWTIANEIGEQWRAWIKERMGATNVDTPYRSMVEMIRDHVTAQQVAARMEGKNLFQYLRADT
jgi:hypothetical protein